MPDGSDTQGGTQAPETTSGRHEVQGDFLAQLETTADTTREGVADVLEAPATSIAEGENLGTENGVSDEVEGEGGETLEELIVYVDDVLTPIHDANNVHPAYGDILTKILEVRGQHQGRSTLNEAGIRELRELVQVARKHQEYAEFERLRDTGYDLKVRLERHLQEIVARGEGKNETGMLSVQKIESGIMHIELQKLSLAELNSALNQLISSENALRHIRGENVVGDYTCSKCRLVNSLTGACEFCKEGNIPHTIPQETKKTPRKASKPTTKKTVARFTCSRCGDPFVTPNSTMRCPDCE